MRTWHVVALAAAGAVAAVALGIAAQRLVGGDEGGAYRGSKPPPGIVLPEFALSDESGRLVRSSELDGKVVIVTFLESKCREACPLVARHVGAALDGFSGKERGRIVALAISTHPHDDTPASARSFLRRYGIEGDVRYLVGSEHELRPVWKAFRILPALDTGDAEMHSVPVRVFDATGEWVATLHPGVDLSADNLAYDVSRALD